MNLFIAEKPSVAQEFAKVIGKEIKRSDGYIYSGDNIFTWCVGHLVKLSYPEAYDEALKKWSLEALPFIPEEYKYEVISSVKKQFSIVCKLINDKRISKIYVCTDSGREGEYIYRLIEEMNGVPKAKRYRVWIDSQTEEEINRGVNEAKKLEEYNNLADSAYLRAKEDYLIGINFSRLLTLNYGYLISKGLGKKHVVIAIGRVMTCVLGMVVKREREIRDFKKTQFFKPTIDVLVNNEKISAEWRYVESSKVDKKYLYKNNGILDEKYAKEFINSLGNEAIVDKKETKKEIKNPPYLFNLAELQNECSKSFKISPDKTLEIAQELYEKKLITYPRTDSKFLSKAIAKEILKNLKGLTKLPKYNDYINKIIDEGRYKNLIKSRYTNDSKVNDHYAIIPTGQGINNFNTLTTLSKQVYGKILLRFISIFLDPAIYKNTKLVLTVDNEQFESTFKMKVEQGYSILFDNNNESNNIDLGSLRKGSKLDIDNKYIKSGETTPPKRYTTGSIILAMENAGSLIEDEELRAVIKTTGIGTSATRAEIIKKLNTNEYIKINPKTQVINSTLLGEGIYEVVLKTIPGLLNPMLSASWEKGLNMVAAGEIDKNEYMIKLKNFVKNKVDLVKKNQVDYNITRSIKLLYNYYKE